LRFKPEKTFKGLWCQIRLEWFCWPDVNFINVLRVRFLYKTFGAKISNPKATFLVLATTFCTKNTCEKSWWNWQQMGKQYVPGLLNVSMLWSLSVERPNVKLRCDERFTHAFTACGCVFKEITLVDSNQDNYFENVTACSKRTLKTTVATQL